MADIADTVAPNADQMVNEDLMDGPRTFTISRVRIKAGADQPADIYLEEFGSLPYRPSKGMRNVMIAGWGPKSAEYVGKRLTLYRDADVRYGKDRLGGIRISHMSNMSNINGPLSVMLRTTRGKRAPFVVQPLAESKPTLPAEDPRIAELTAEWHQATDARRAEIVDEVAVIRQTTTTEGEQA